MATFVLVHGAFGGAWSWNRTIVPRLRAAGHEAMAVTLTGLGERTHLASPEVTLDTHIQDVVNVLFYEDLHAVTLVGHSYGGMVITGVADRCPERLAQLVYLDAAVPADGEAIADRAGPDGRAERSARAAREGDGWRVPPGPPQADDPPQFAAWAGPRRSPQPLRTLIDPIHLEHGETTLPRAFVYCAAGKASDSPQARRAQALRADPRWRCFELATGHNLQYSAPAETAAILLELVRP